ncbi:hypothetical protein LJ207_10040 [Halanaerobium sp. Z-7514]|uniref:Transposase n=1 Tax=Halanaerobium polyolivorans TaxID=2886943 RepID=A0AAW4X1N6_9FIRM|nr:hypothetical protein [Halanaerobium polyolivorans]MCC3145664.1 hypothetical protein [Halanaerobium polyolivorans]
MAKEHCLSYTSIKNSVNVQIDSLIEKDQFKNLNNIEAISIDEIAIKKKHKYGVALTDPMNGKLIDILPSSVKVLLFSL